MDYSLNVELPLLAEEVCLFSVRGREKLTLNTCNEVAVDVILLTNEIKSQYPELYKHLEETPIAFSKISVNEITSNELENYRDTLNKLLCNHFNAHELDVSDWNINF
jgi:hypothetical protein